MAAGGSRAAGVGFSFPAGDGPCVAAEWQQKEETRAQGTTIEWESEREGEITRRENRIYITGYRLASAGIITIIVIIPLQKADRLSSLFTRQKKKERWK